MTDEANNENKAKELQEMMADENFRLDVDALEAAAGDRVIPFEELISRRPSVDTYADDWHGC